VNRVLLVTPRHDERDRLALCARRAGYSVRSTGDALEAPAMVREWHPHIVIAPLECCTAEGEPLIAALRALPSVSPVGIIALLPPDQRDLRPALLAGADDALPAPVGEPALLESCYRSSIALAARHDLRSLAFPAISTGIYRFPADLAARIALETTRHALPGTRIDSIIFCCFDATSAGHYHTAFAETN